MFDPNAVVCSSVHSASVGLFTPAEVRALSVCKISDTNVFVGNRYDSNASSSAPGGEGADSASSLLAAAARGGAGGGAMPLAVSGGLHDRRLGSLDNRDACATCGCRSECPGHLGHIELALPVFQPIFLRGVVNLMKLVRSCSQADFAVSLREDKAEQEQQAEEVYRHGNIHKQVQTDR